MLFYAKPLVKYVYYIYFHKVFYAKPLVKYVYYIYFHKVIRKIISKVIMFNLMGCGCMQPAEPGQLPRVAGPWLSGGASQLQTTERKRRRKKWKRIETNR